MSLEPRNRSPRGATGGGNFSSDDRPSPQRSTPGDLQWHQDQRTPLAAAEPSANEPHQPVGATADLVDKAKETARATAKAISSQATELAGNIGSELTETAEEQKSYGADAMRGFAKAVLGAANELDGQSPTVARYVRSAAESVEGLSDTIRSRSVRDLITTASDTARTHPAAFFIGAVAAGFALSRFFKSSSKGSAMPGADGSTDTHKQIPEAFNAAGEGAAGFGGRP